MALKFNEQSEKPRFMIKRNQLVRHSWLIMEYDPGKKIYDAVGEYLLLNTEEDPDITQKKLHNLAGILNGKDNLVEFKNLTNERILFNVISETPESEQQKIFFKTYDGRGVAKDNAVLTIKKEILEDENIS